MKAIVFLVLLCVYVIAPAQSINPGVTQDNIGETICKRGWTATIRPPVSYTNRIKRELMTDDGIPWVDAHLYELDHWVPIELGGHPSDPANLRLQAWDGPDGAHAKDVVETRMKRKVCAGEVSLKDAQACIWFDWRACP